MTPVEFKAWRKGRGLKQKDAAELLGLKKRVIQYYEKGKRDGKTVEVPRAVELACWAITQGVGGYDGETAMPLAAVRTDGEAAPTAQDAAAPEAGDPAD